jgi:membrane-bound serine protease (ClpP class)
VPVVARIVLLRWLLLAALLLVAPADAGSGTVRVLTIKGAIGPATASYVADGIEAAETAGDTAVLLRLDTPGGLDKAMRDIIRAILNADVAVIGYVTPSGARAASAGTYILYASHIAAMAPGTNLGAATPVSVGGGGGLPGTGGGNNEDESGSSAKERKRVNDAVAYIRSLADLRGRNAEWAEKAVRDAASLEAEAALANEVIDRVAESAGGLLRAVDGDRVEVAGSEQRLRTAEASLVQQQPDWRERLLALISNPNVAYILMLIGIYGIIFELANPGAIIPGVVGSIALLLALFALQALPVNYAGMALIALGIGLMLAEAFAPSFGVLGLGGVVAFVAGSILLFDGGQPGFQLAWGVIAGATASSLLVILGAGWLAARSFRQPVVSGQPYLEGAQAAAVDDFNDAGYVRLQGELWWAHTTVPIAAGQRVRVIRVNGLQLVVEPLPESATTP